MSNGCVMQVWTGHRPVLARRLVAGGPDAARCDATVGRTSGASPGTARRWRLRYHVMRCPLRAVVAVRLSA